ncbi:hypothetical protein [Paenibacillus sp. Soil522]|uniref:hypothetical protein n=1 Tax=Paenibacillus sp. Soil522 TaxID=1736388 RepID=UPI000700633F|nr:hypothetical protein [Paenibacillus sp. Soil522]KRE54455.1 hypothetical protein ASG81_01730 [Paenibacillus sp. Soil522]
MWIVFGILTLAVVIAFIDVPYLLKQGLKKELWTFSILLLLGTGLSIAEGLQVEIPNPMDALAFIYKPLIDLLFGLFK